MEYDYLIVGSGLFGSIFAHEMEKKGKKCLVIEKRNHIGGNIFTENVENINVHKYGPHIFHTNRKDIWEYMSQFVEFNNFIYSPMANYKGKLFNLPFNMNTFYQMWGVKTPKEALDKINSQKTKNHVENPKNLEEQAINLVGKDIYEILVKGYTEKQWGKNCKELPSFIIKRLPVRFTFDNNYFNDRYQGIPIGGYTQIIEKMLDNIPVLLNTDFFDNKDKWLNIADKIIFTGMIDKFYDYCFGELEYRSLKFESEILDFENYQGVAAVNYNEFEVPYTRCIEHKHFEFISSDKTVITREYPQNWDKSTEPYYPINDNKNNKLYDKYVELANKDKNIIFCGRLGSYKYYDMWQIVDEALKLVNKELD